MPWTDSQTGWAWVVRSVLHEESVSAVDQTGVMVEMVVEQQTPALVAPGSAMQRLRAAVAAENAAQATKAAAILDLAHENSWLCGDEFELVGRRLVRVGADETPLVDEALPLEVAALMGTSVGAATVLI